MKLEAAAQLTAHSKDTQVVNTKTVRHGLPITIEHPKGTQRKLHDDAGNVVYKVHMHNSYGYFNNTKGRDGDEVDCFLGPDKNAKEVYVVHMKDMGPVPSEREDEDKCFIGFTSPVAAKTAFLLHYPENFFESMTTLPVALFKRKMKQAQLPHREKKIHAAAILRAYCLAAKGKKCPDCGSKNFVLMPTDFETAKCKACGKTWDTHQ